MNDAGDDTRTIEFLNVAISITLEAPATHYLLLMSLDWFCACLQKAINPQSQQPFNEVRKTTLGQPLDSTLPSQLAQLTC